MLYQNLKNKISKIRAIVETDPIIDEISEAIESGNTARALEQMRCLFRQNLPVPVSACADFLRFLRSLVAHIPKPEISDVAIEYCSLPHGIIARARQYEETRLQFDAETTAYRWHEARGEFAEARAVISGMQSRTDETADPELLGVLINNYGYEYLLEGDPAAAEPYFIQALDLFERAGSDYETVNARANFLTCRFATLSFEEQEALLPELAETQSVLHGRGDWRVRKTMRIYAERASARGRLSVAVGWANRAADASRDVPTQLHQDDENYARCLDRRRRRWSPSNHRSGVWPEGRTKTDEAGKLTAPVDASIENSLVHAALMGAETEYAFTPIGADGSVLNRTLYSGYLVSLAADHYSLLHGRDEHDLFLANGGRLYVDSGVGLINIEYSSPECANPEELIAHVRAGDEILASLARELEQKYPELERAFISKCNFDYSGHTSGAHENYLHTASQKKLAPQLIPHLVSRVIYTGGGGFHDSALNLQFMLSPRVRFLKRVKSSGSQNNRAIFSTRKEPLSSSQFGRLHLLCGEGVRYDMAEYLRFGVTALLVNLIDSGVIFADDIDLIPLHAMNIVARDVRCKESIGRINGVPATAIEVQRHYLSQVRAHVGRPCLPEWADTLCQRWQATLDGLEKDPMQLAGILDWPTKLGLYRAFVEQRGYDWERLIEQARKSDREIRAELFEFDVRFGDISEDGLFASITKDTRPENKLVCERAVDDAHRTPPQGTRAKLRGEWIERLSNNRSNKRCDWNSIHDHQKKSSLFFDDPFGSGAVEWS